MPIKKILGLNIVSRANLGWVWIGWLATPFSGAGFNKYHTSVTSSLGSGGDGVLRTAALLTSVLRGLCGDG